MKQEPQQVNKENISNIGQEYLNNLYADSSMETEEPQPLYILHRDTVKSFLHEKINLLSSYGMFLGLLGIEVTIIISLATTNFHDLWNIRANLIEGTFISFSLIFGVKICYCLKQFIKRENIDVDKLTDDLGKRGTVIKPRSMNTHS